MNLIAWLQYLESLPSSLTKRSLGDVKNTAQKLNLLKFSGKVITVAGTNGKGSCVAFLEAILLVAGLKVGAYISPHILHYNERVRVNGKDVDDKTLCEAFALVEQARENAILSYFDFSTLSALLIFKQQQLDVLLLEVGIGGRIDAVNIIDNDLAIISTISLDHTQILGNSREAIGYEKSGIMRPFKPVICGNNMPDSVYATANKLHAKLYCLGQDFSYYENNSCWHWQCGQTNLQNLPLVRLPVSNAALSLMAIKLLTDDFNISHQAIYAGLKSSYLLGRWQQMKYADKEIIFDVAHNPESTALLASNLNKIKSAGRILAVISMLKDKDIVATLQPLVHVVDKWYVGALESKRAATLFQLTLGLESCGVTNFTISPLITISLQQAIAECEEKDKIAVFGSFQTVAAGLKMIGSVGNSLD